MLLCFQDLVCLSSGSPRSRPKQRISVRIVYWALQGMWWVTKKSANTEMLSQVQASGICARIFPGKTNMEELPPSSEVFEVLGYLYSITGY